MWKDKRIDEKYHFSESGESERQSWFRMILISHLYNQNPYNHVYCEIVTETIFDNSTQISDKPYKPILNYLPFIYVTSFEANDLKSMGYESFDFIDESYDDIKDCSKRLEKSRKKF